MEPVPTVPPDSILEEESQCSLPRALATALTPTPTLNPTLTPAFPQSSSLVTASTDLLHKVENIPTRFEPAPQTGHSIFKEQLICSYEVHKLNVDTAATPCSPPTAEMLRGTIDYVQSNRPVPYSHFPGLMSPFQAPVLNPPTRDFPPAVCPRPWNCHGFPSPGTMVFGGLPPMHFEPRAPGNSCMVNTGYLPPPPPFSFSSGPCMVINMPEFCHGACLPPHQMFLTPEGYPGWCMGLPLEAFYQTYRPVLVYNRKDNMALNGPQTSEDRREEKEEHKVFLPDMTKEQGSRVFSKPLAAFQDRLQMERTWEDSKDVPNAFCLKNKENETPATEIGSFMDHQDDLGNDTNSMDMDDMNCLFPSDLNTFDFTLEDLQSLMEESLDPPLNETNAEKTPPPPSEIERIIQYLLSDAPIPEYERKSYQNKLDLLAEDKPKKKLRGFSAFQRTPVEEKLMYPNMSFPLDSHFEDLTSKNSREVNDDCRKRRSERESKKRFLKTETQSRETARKKGILNDSKSNFCTDIRWSQRARDHTNELDGDGYPFRARERKPANKNQEHRKFLDKWQESRVPQGKPLDFLRRMEMSSEWLSSIKEEPREKERGRTSKVARQKPQSKKTDRLKPTPKTTKRSSSKKAAGGKEYEDSGEPLRPRGLMKGGRGRETKHKITQPAKASRKTKAEVYKAYFPPNVSVKSKSSTTVGKYRQKAKYKPKCPSKRMKTLLSMKTAEGGPESDGFPFPALNEVQKQRFLGGKTKNQKVPQRRGNGLKIKPEAFKEEAYEEEEEEPTSTARKHQQRSSTSEKRKGGADKTPEILCSSPVKKYRDSEQRGPKIRIKRERGTLRATWLHIE
ncbi:uncharacterized protein LOC103480374 [Poecilia reticulata]|uniref:uncharacterized protein LOC103480374 n=1 Tax=Poecilia reticulata TaxID=8081 RepID=UPI0004A483F5|nr:PREDICTED: uncharacterized protein LOC103480374 [Poecilia reticulata]XP_008433509.1 PREDICTED: uncharacterized protein LOC103480374 [Poecilia reticulata]